MQILATTMALPAVFNLSQAEELQTVDQTKFVKLITEERYMLALFCKEFEGGLSAERHQGGLDRCDEW